MVRVPLRKDGGADAPFSNERVPRGRGRCTETPVSFVIGMFVDLAVRNWANRFLDSSEERNTPALPPLYFYSV